ncbi:unnamed protein product [Plutella xylostella]|uniref:(diamondback moth) hypothetical protein n=1 Tax=Plutella xylostella TaxID=51655 RepID=A0A8S4E4C2_PLUXY|nr:unnamed protein product [Plutella xylostella]
MVRHYKRKTVTKYCKEHLLKALEDIRNKKLNYSQAAKVYGIPTSTLVSRIRRRLKKSLNDEEQAEVSASSALVPLGSKPGSKKQEPPEIKTYKNNYFLKKYGPPLVIPPVAPSGLTCSACSYSIVGRVYACVQCAGVRVCAACERDTHRAHAVLRLPSERVYNIVRDVFVSLQREFNSILKLLDEDNEKSTFKDILKDPTPSNATLDTSAPAPVLPDEPMVEYLIEKDTHEELDIKPELDPLFEIPETSVTLEATHGCSSPEIKLEGVPPVEYLLDNHIEEQHKEPPPKRIAKKYKSVVRKKLHKSRFFESENILRKCEKSNVNNTVVANDKEIVIKMNKPAETLLNVERANPTDWCPQEMKDPPEGASVDSSSYVIVRNSTLNFCQKVPRLNQPTSMITNLKKTINYRDTPS